MKKLIKIMILLQVFVMGVYSQNDTQLLSKKEMRKQMPSYIEVSLGSSSSNFRDFATSPLFYKGRTNYTSLSRSKINQDRELDFGVAYFFGNCSSTFNDHITSSSLKTVSLYYSRLYKLEKLSSNEWNTKIGGLLYGTGNFRTNMSLQNNASGLELIPTVLGSVKISKSFKPQASKSKKILFIKYQTKPKTRNLAYRLNIGLVNSSYRNGYVYAGQSDVLNAPKITDDYEFKMFSGFRMSSALDYTVSLKNKNKVQLSYLWDAYKTGGNLDPLEMAQHTLKLTLLFNTNNK